MKQVSNFNHYSQTNYRDDIQSIRAIGAILVVVFHIWIHKVSGGVDVFFVISGFLMSNIMLRQIASKGSIDFIGFWSNIAARVAPPAYIVILVTLALGFIWIPKIIWLDFFNDAIFSSLHLENLKLIRLNSDYLTRENTPSAFQHFWALSLQIQFYVILPIYFYLASWLCAKLNGLLPLKISCIMIFFISLIYSIYLTKISSVTAYYHVGTRLWEFFAGVILAVFLPHIATRINSIVSKVLACSGLTILLSVGIIIPREFSFPGYISLLPVLGAATLIIAGSGRDSKGFLSNHYLSSFGKISFTFYLWHWPLLIFSRHHFQSEDLSFSQGMIVIVIAIILSLITHLYLEKPLKNKLDGKRLLKLATAVTFFVPAITFATISKKVVLHTQQARDLYWQNKSIQPFTGNMISIEEPAIAISQDDLIAAKGILPVAYTANCHQNITSPKVLSCDYGNTRSLRKVVLVGGSHSTQWLPALSEIALANNIRLINITKSSCSFGAYIGSHPSCLKWNAEALALIKDLQPYAVITTSSRAGDRDFKEHVPPAYLAAWKEISDVGIKIVGIRDNPTFPFDVPQCLFKNIGSPLTCSIPRNLVYTPTNPAAEYLLTVPNLKLVDLTDFMCVKNTCIGAFSGYLMYRDKHHLSVPYVRFLKLALEKELKQAIPELTSE